MLLPLLVAAKEDDDDDDEKREHRRHLEHDDDDDDDAFDDDVIDDDADAEHKLVANMIADSCIYSTFSQKSTKSLSLAQEYVKFFRLLSSEMT